jgi:hypothetical protein
VSVTGSDSSNADQATINILPDDALLEIFYFCGGGFDYLPPAWWWKRLTDVCQRWRFIIFASPHFLDLQLECTDRTPTRTSLDIWPLLPIAISSDPCVLGGQDNIIAALEQHDRVIQINLRHFPLETFSTVTRKPFPVLRDLRLASFDKIVLDEELLGGLAPRLQSITLENIAFPGFPKLALSFSSLSTLTLRSIPITGYISPEAMATCLATLPSLEFLSIEFESPRSRPNRIGLPSPTRAVLPALIQFEFSGVSEYLEDFLGRIDTPNLGRLIIRLFMDLVFNIPQLHRFIVRTESIRLLNPAEIKFFSWVTKIILGPVSLDILCSEPDWQASSMAQLCSQLSPLLSHVEQLYIREETLGQALQGNGINPTQFLELFHPFPALQRLHIYDELRPLVARALQELTGESATEVLPSLRSLVFRGPLPSGSIQKDIEEFITARQNLNHPVDVEWKE